MGFFSIIFGFTGFGIGISIGLVAGYFLFIYFQPIDVQNPVIRPLVEQDSEALQRMLPEIPLWVKNPDYDRTDWLNKFVEYMWPYLDKAICMTARNIAKPIIAEQIPKYKIESVEFEELTLGSLPPTFQEAASAWYNAATVSHSIPQYVEHYQSMEVLLLYQLHGSLLFGRNFMCCRSCNSCFISP